MWEITIMPEYMSGRDSGGGAYGKVKCSRCVEEMIKKSWKFFQLSLLHGRHALSYKIIVEKKRYQYITGISFLFRVYGEYR